jgi:membrane protein insertase Oxa1/YidC/SpoIIIJ
MFMRFKCFYLKPTCLTRPLSLFEFSISCARRKKCVEKLKFLVNDSRKIYVASRSVNASVLRRRISNVLMMSLPSFATPSRGLRTVPRQSLTDCSVILMSDDEANSFVIVTGLVSLCEMIMHTFHFQFGLPWLLTPAVTILLFRLLALPLVIYQFRNLAQFQMISPLYVHALRRWFQCRYRGDVTGCIAYAKRLRLLSKGTGIHPLKSLISSLLFLPIWWSLIRAVRELVVCFPSLKTSGMLWFSDLTVPDPYYLLPVLWVLTLAFNLWLVSLSSSSFSSKKTQISHRWPVHGFALYFGTRCNLFSLFSFGDVIAISTHYYLGTSLLCQVASFAPVVFDSERTLRSRNF